MLAIPNYALSNCNSVENVILPAGLTKIGVSAFNGTSLTDVELPESLITVDTYAFANTKLNNIVLTDHIASIGTNAFENCASLKSVVIPSSVTTIGEYAFSGCETLSSVTLNRGLKTIGRNAFSNTSITSLKIPNSVSSMSTWISNGGTYRSALLDATKLKTVEFEEGMLAIPDYALLNCSSVVNVILPDGLTKIGTSAFNGCSSISSMVIPESVTTIGSSAFSGCSNLTITAKKGSVGYNYAVNNNISVNEIACSHENIETVVVTAPDCENDGYEKIVCTYCQEVLKEGAIDKLGHKFTIETITQKPTCLTTGVKQIICATCGLSQYEDIDLSGHTESDWIIDEEPTCVKKGVKHKICTVCKETVETADIPTVEHKMGAWKIRVKPTDSEQGVAYRLCSHCGFEELDEIEVGSSLPQITVSDTLGTQGRQVKVAVTLENNPGIASMTLRISYDTTVMKLINVEDCGKLGEVVHSDQYTNPYVLCWANDTALQDYVVDGEVAILTFEINDTATFYACDGIVSVVSGLIGDVNDDGSVDNLDRLELTRYLANWKDYTEDMINKVGADVNCDGSIDNLDRLVLTRHLANWEGYEDLYALAI